MKMEKNVIKEQKTVIKKVDNIMQQKVEMVTMEEKIMDNAKTTKGEVK